MRKIYIFIIIALVALAASCKHEVIVREENVQVVVDPVPQGQTPFTVSLAEAATRTAVDIGTGRITWVSDDPVLVSNGSEQMTLYVIEGGSTTAGLYSEEELITGDTFYAVYPAEGGSFSGGLFSTVIPSVQNYVAGGFATQTFPMVAIADANRNLAFRNAASLLKLDIGSELFEGVGVSSIALTADKPLVGSLEVAYSLGMDPEVQLVDGERTLTIKGPEGGIPFGESVYAVVAPGDYTKIHARISLTNGLYYDCDIEGEYGVNRSAYRKVPVNIVDKYIDLSAEETANCYMITSPGYYKFRVDVKGNGVGTSCGLPAQNSAITGLKVYCTDGQPFVDGSFALYGNYIYFSTLDDPSESNYNRQPRGTALVSVLGESEEGEPSSTLWSWHIWSNGRIRDVELSDGSTWLNMNLGARQVGFESSGYNGYYYQWGRKDPFIQKYTTDTEPATLSPFVSHASKVDGSLENSIANPHIFYGGYYPNDVSDRIEDWSSYDDAEKVYDWWNAGVVGDARYAEQAAKTMFDPCPVGYHVPVYSDLAALYSRARENGKHVAKAWWIEDALYLPFTSYRYIRLDLSAWQSGANPTVLVPCAIPSETGARNHRRYAALRLTGSGSVELTKDVAVRSFGVPVRCIKDGTSVPPVDTEDSTFPATIEDMETDYWE